ncbi:MAG: B12-binding domain-containing radical SAM protein [Acetatifactor sp.]|nr:B12-binding domain-containing radical SAM protein [Acetatifactor sp.]
MKFLLVAVNAKYIHSNPAIYSLKAFAGEETGKHVELAEYTINQYGSEILADIYRRRPNAIGFSCYIWNFHLVQELLAELPKLLPDTELWLGGPEVSFDSEKILEKYPQLTGIMVGEGEVTFRELMQYYTAREREILPQAQGLEKIAGLCLLSGYTAPRAPVDLTALPFFYPDYMAEGVERGSFANKILYYETSRGCPYRCSYCLSSGDEPVRFRDMDVIKRELRFFLDMRIKQVKFVDRTFNCNPKHTIEIWKYLHENDNGVTNFHFEISADILREEEIELLQQFRPGLVQLEIGVQSTNPQTLQAIRRVMDVDKLERAVARIRERHNIHQHLDLIAGLPYEDYGSFGHSFDRVYRMRPDQLQLGFLKVLKGSVMREQAAEYGICYLDRPPYEVLYTKWLSYEDVLRLKRIEEMVEVYYNSGQYAHTIRFLEQAFHRPFALFEALAEFYEEKGFFRNSPARVYRYEVLLQFAEKWDSAFVPIYKELLTYDLYLRENMKSRPSFAKDVTEQAVKAQIREFYRREEQEQKWLPDYGEYDKRQLIRMTHLEPFVYPVWDGEALAACRATQTDSVSQMAGVSQEADGDAQKPLRYVLFDYQHRNPLTYEAASQVVEFWVMPDAGKEEVL